LGGNGPSEESLRRILDQKASPDACRKSYGGKGGDRKISGSEESFQRIGARSWRPASPGLLHAFRSRPFNETSIHFERDDDDRVTKGYSGGQRIRGGVGGEKGKGGEGGLQAIGKKKKFAIVVFLSSKEPRPPKRGPSIRSGRKRKRAK